MRGTMRLTGLASARHCLPRAPGHCPAAGPRLQAGSLLENAAAWRVQERAQQSAPPQHRRPQRWGG
jgi:hypothetical protein